MNLGVRLFKLRELSGQSLQHVADAVEASKPHIWEIEKEKATNPSMELVARLARHFDVTVSYLMGEDIEADDADVKLQSMFRKAKGLNDDDREILNDMMDSLLSRRKKDLGLGNK